MYSRDTQHGTCAKQMPNASITYIYMKCLVEGFQVYVYDYPPVGDVI